MASQTRLHHNPWDPVSITSHSDGTVEMWWRVWWWENSPGPSGWAHCNHNSPSEGCGESQNQETATKQSLEWIWRKRPRFKECKHPWEAAKGKETASPLTASGRNQSSDTFALAQWNWSSDLWDCKRVNLCCFKPRSLWWVFTATVEN